MDYGFVFPNLSVGEYGFIFFDFGLWLENKRFFFNMWFFIALCLGGCFFFFLV